MVLGTLVPLDERDIFQRTDRSSRRLPGQYIALSAVLPTVLTPPSNLPNSLIRSADSPDPGGLCSPHPVVHHQPELPPLYPCSLTLCMEPGNRRT